MKELEFLSENHEPLEALAKKLHEAEKIDGIEDMIELKARQKASDIVREWMVDLFGKAYQDYSPPEEDNLYRRLNRQHQVDDADNNSNL